MNVAASDHPARSCIDGQPQDVAPSACLARHHPVSAAPVDVPDAIEAIASRDPYCVLSVDATSAIDPDTIAIDGYALRDSVGDDGTKRLNQAEHRCRQQNGENLVHQKSPVSLRRSSERSSCAANRPRDSIEISPLGNGGSSPSSKRRKKRFQEKCAAMLLAQTA
jgi:hypothetical protein